jgi:hypothetical protein
MQTESFRRHADGSIDYDFYRRSAAVERRAAIKDAASAMAAFVTRLVRRARATAPAGGTAAAQPAG